MLRDLKLRLVTVQHHATPLFNGNTVQSSCSGNSLH